MRTAAPLRGSSASLSRASNRCSIEFASLLATSSRRLRRAANFLTILCLRRLFSIALFFAIKGLRFSAFEPRVLVWRSPGSLPEREVEGAQQSARLVVCLGRSADHDVKTQHRFRLVVVDFGENDVLFHAERVIAAAVETLWVGRPLALGSGLPPPLGAEESFAALAGLPPLSLASAIDQISGTLGETDLAAVFEYFEADARRLAVFGIGDRQIAEVDRRLFR